MSGCILVVDDNAANLALLDHLLRTQGYDVRLASDAQEALSLLEQEVPRLILMDLQLPGVDGFELTRRLKAGDRTQGIPIVAVRSYAMPGGAQRALAAGCDGYVSKPIDVRSFTGQIAGYLNAR
jgi:CheY-like chemotaxis protein